MKKISDRRGVTLIELLVSLSLLGMLLALAYLVFGHLWGTYNRTEQKWLLERNVNQMTGTVQNILDLSYGMELTDTVPGGSALDSSASLLYYDAVSGNVCFQDKADDSGTRPALVQLNEDNVSLVLSFKKAEKTDSSKYNNALDVTVTGTSGDMSYAQTVTIYLRNLHGNISTANDDAAYTVAHFASTADGATLNLKRDTVPGGCFIATAAYGEYDEPGVMLLRRFRDQVLLQSAPGQWFVETYYQLSPPVANIIAVHPALRLITRILLLPVQGVAVALLHPLFSLVIATAYIALWKLAKRRFNQKRFRNNTWSQKSRKFI